MTALSFPFHVALYAVRSSGEVAKSPDAVRGRQHLTELDVRQLAEGLSEDLDRVAHSGRRDRAADADVIALDAIGGVTPIETDGAAPVTRIVPLSVGCRASWY